MPQKKTFDIDASFAVFVRRDDGSRVDLGAPNKGAFLLNDLIAIDSNRRSSFIRFYTVYTHRIFLRALSVYLYKRG